jgi:hypothetical protein
MTKDKYSIEDILLPQIGSGIRVRHLIASSQNIQSESFVGRFNKNITSCKEARS